MFVKHLSYFVSMAQSYCVAIICYNSMNKSFVPSVELRRVGIYSVIINNFYIKKSTGNYKMLLEMSVLDFCCIDIWSFFNLNLIKFCFL